MKPVPSYYPLRIHTELWEEIREHLDRRSRSTTPKECDRFIAEAIRVRIATEEHGRAALVRTRLAAFLFRLGRDNLPSGIIEEQVRVVEDAHDGTTPVVYNNDGHGRSAEILGQWAEEMAERLTPENFA